MPRHMQHKPKALSAEPLQRPAARGGSSRNACRRCGGQQQWYAYGKGSDTAPHCTTDSLRYTLAKQASRWCLGWGKAAWVAPQRNCIAPELMRPNVLKGMVRSAYPGHAWSA
jgi:hypothetical protein